MDWNPIYKLIKEETMDKSFQGYLLISDMDGTLINSKGKISDKNIKAINRFVDKGGIFTLATGRMMESVRRYLHNLPIKVPIILYNGTKIHDFIKEETIFELFLEDGIKEMIKKLKEYDSSLGIEIYSQENVYIFNPCRFTERFSKKGYEVYYEISEQLWFNNWTKILILGEEEQMNELEENFRVIFGETNLIRSGENFLEIVPENTSKGHALGSLSKMLNIDMSKVIAVGDNMNDLELLTNAGYGFCVANGNKRLLSVTKYKCSSNDEHAIEDVVTWAEKNLIV